MMLRSYGELVAALGSRVAVRRMIPEAETVVVEKESVEVMVRWDSAGQLLHVMEAIPRRISSVCRQAVESEIALVNHHLAVPGFGIDPDTQLVYFRMSVPRRDDGTMSLEEVVRILRICVRTTRQYAARILEAGVDVNAATLATR
jgi:hypothetical protein